VAKISEWWYDPPDDREDDVEKDYEEAPDYDQDIDDRHIYYLPEHMHRDM
jgi:hypothetical protein